MRGSQIPSGVLLFWIAVLSAGCALETPAGATRRHVKAAGVRAEVWTPADEPRSIGTYRALVRLRDGTEQEIRGERDGTVSGVWMSDLEGDAAPELVVAMTSAGSGSYGTIHVYREEGGRYVERPLRPLANPQARGYMGHDAFEVRNGRLYRSFPRYRESDPNAAPTGGAVRLVYSFDQDAWVDD